MVFDIYFDKFQLNFKKALNKTTQFRTTNNNLIILEMNHLIWDQRSDQVY
jgi:hypothetical protein